MPFVFTLEGKVIRQEQSRRITRGTQTREVRCREPLQYDMMPIIPRLYTVVQKVSRKSWQIWESIIRQRIGILVSFKLTQ